MTIYSNSENLEKVQNAIGKIIDGERLVEVRFTGQHGDVINNKYTDVSLGELHKLEQQMQHDLEPMPLMHSVEIEVGF